MNDSDLSSHIGQWITVTLKSGKTQQGYFYTMDPDTKSMIMYAQPSAFVVLGHSIEHYHFDDPTRTMDITAMEAALGCRTDHVPTTQKVNERKRGLISYMEKRRVPITYSTDDPVIMVLGCARVTPPYVSTSVTGDGNVILVKRVRDLVAGYDNLLNSGGMA